eukprot:GHVN01102747.1.p2 GENE.GHVN01102747.1~~GHVN01102747.1.p2  ORF type:complete len:114 (-),score=1.34 GHVN01102747.1:987-1328(-)
MEKKKKKKKGKESTEKSLGQDGVRYSSGLVLYRIDIQVLLAEPLSGFVEWYGMFSSLVLRYFCPRTLESRELKLNPLRQVKFSRNHFPTLSCLRGLPWTNMSPGIQAAENLPS